MNAPIDDREFADYLRRGSRVSRQYRDLGEIDVPAHLDERILGEARNAIAPDDLARVRDKRRRLMQWGIPATLAACSLLVISIVIRSGLQHEVVPAQVSPAERPVAAPAAARTAAEEPAKQEQGVVLIAPPRDAVTEFSSLAPAPAPARAAAQARIDRERAEERARAQSIATHAKRVEEELLRSSMAAPQTIAPTGAGDAPASAPVAAAAAPPRRAFAPQPESVAQDSAAVRREARGYEDESASEEIAVTGMRQRNAAARSGPRGTVRSAAAGSVSDEQLEQDEMRAQPERWLEHIRELRRDGKSGAADREWQDFREQYPDHVVAEDDLARADR